MLVLWTLKKCRKGETHTAIPISILDTTAITPSLKMNGFDPGSRRDDFIESHWRYVWIVFSSNYQPSDGINVGQTHGPLCRERSSVEASRVSSHEERTIIDPKVEHLRKTWVKGAGTVQSVVLGGANLIMSVSDAPCAIRDNTQLHCNTTCLLS
ncbi:hypothetical protein FVEG_14918 [Fusarium verticillioides 7600]|uniref:Uncharacterized protein n=1 Tax=Gibberella moniliformis (strain M3125 / FGSC 7600) TaxID=334819 RepID=W7LGM1_GIBM7|nr:hypothetical protein FVEG_14918 [Fusarium verticillioides 7600]EWG38568.1 hypothetical protein FVEG_14918 [Fusarium verticillioides 7600]